MATRSIETEMELSMLLEDDDDVNGGSSASSKSWNRLLQSMKSVDSSKSSLHTSVGFLEASVASMNISGSALCHSNNYSRTTHSILWQPLPPDESLSSESSGLDDPDSPTAIEPNVKACYTGKDTKQQSSQYPNSSFMKSTKLDGNIGVNLLKSAYAEHSASSYLSQIKLPFEADFETGSETDARPLRQQQLPPSPILKKRVCWEPKQAPLVPKSISNEELRRRNDFGHHSRSDLTQECPSDVTSVTFDPMCTATINDISYSPSNSVVTGPRNSPQQQQFQQRESFGQNPFCTPNSLISPQQISNWLAFQQNKLLSSSVISGNNLSDMALPRSGLSLLVDAALCGAKGRGTSTGSTTTNSTDRGSPDTQQNAVFSNITTANSPMGAVSMMSQQLQQQQLHHQQQLAHQGSSSHQLSNNARSFDISPQQHAALVAQQLHSIQCNNSNNNSSTTSFNGCQMIPGTEFPCTTISKGQTFPPLKPLSAYNYFFRDERDRILAPGSNDTSATPTHNHNSNTEAAASNSNNSNDASIMTSGAAAAHRRQHKLLWDHWQRDRTKKRAHRKSHGKISFQELSKLISSRWKALNRSQQDYYREVASLDLKRFQLEIKLQGGNATTGDGNGKNGKSQKPKKSSATPTKQKAEY